MVTKSRIDELLAQRKQIEDQLQQERENAISEIRDRIAIFNIQSEELFEIGSKNRKRKLAKVKPKYRHPETGATWTGRGKAPAWLQGKDGAVDEKLKKKYLIADAE